MCIVGRMYVAGCMSQLKAIFFDIDDTLYSTTAFAARARRNSVNAMIKAGLQLPHAVVLKELEEVINEFSSNYEHHFDKLLLRVPRRCYEGINSAVLIAAAVVAYHETKFRELTPFSDVPRVLKWLATTDLVRGIITAGLEVKQAEKLIRLDLYKYFTPSAIFISDQIGISKPNPKLYQRACSELNIAPAEAMYVGDNPLSDIDPPNKIGMITVLNTPPDKHRGGKYQLIHGRTKPRHIIHNFHQLINLLKKHYDIRPVPHGMVPLTGSRIGMTTINK